MSVPAWVTTLNEDTGNVKSRATGRPDTAHDYPQTRRGAWHFLSDSGFRQPLPWAKTVLEPCARGLGSRAQSRLFGQLCLGAKPIVQIVTRGSAALLVHFVGPKPDSILEFIESRIQAAEK